MGIMVTDFWKRALGRRRFIKETAAGLLVSLARPLRVRAAPGTPLFWITRIPHQPFTDFQHKNNHAGVDALLQSMGEQGLKFYRSASTTGLASPAGMIAANDVVLIKVNAQWKYRGCTNSDVIRGLIQVILDHPDGFTGEVVVMENGQGRGSLNCDTSKAYGDSSVHANANNETHTFTYLVDQVFADPRVSSYLLDSIRATFIASDAHDVDGYRHYENVSYPCFTTAGGRRVELREGLWQGGAYTQNLKLINVPVLKHHVGSELTASLKHVYGILSMQDGRSGYRHYDGLGETCGKMMVSVRTPVLNLVDAIWVSHLALQGYPASSTFRANQLLASQDPVALDYWAAKYILYPIDENPRHHPDFPTVSQWLSAARQTINDRGGLYHPESGILVNLVTQDEAEMQVFRKSCLPDTTSVLNLLLDP
jgi:uncharacterized protein (DUF362 family)